MDLKTRMQSIPSHNFLVYPGLCVSSASKPHGESTSFHVTRHSNSPLSSSSFTDAVWVDVTFALKCSDNYVSRQLPANKNHFLLHRRHPRHRHHQHSEGRRREKLCRAWAEGLRRCSRLFHDFAPFE